MFQKRDISDKLEEYSNVVSKLVIELAYYDKTKNDAVEYTARYLGNLIERLDIDGRQLEVIENDIHNAQRQYNKVLAKNNITREAAARISPEERRSRRIKELEDELAKLKDD